MAMTLQPRRLPETDQLIGDAEVTGIQFEFNRLVVDLVNKNVEKQSQVVFTEIGFYQFGGDGPLILDSIVKHESVSDALQSRAISGILKNEKIYPRDPSTWLVHFSHYHLYEFVLISGSLAFVVCGEATLSPWKDRH